MHQVQTEGENALVDIPALVSTLRTQRGTMVQASVSWMGEEGGGQSREGVLRMKKELNVCTYVKT